MPIESRPESIRTEAEKVGKALHLALKQKLTEKFKTSINSGIIIKGDPLVVSKYFCKGENEFLGPEEWKFVKDEAQKILGMYELDLDKISYSFIENDGKYRAQSIVINNI